jgi:hypothetical protein
MSVMKRTVYFEKAGPSNTDAVMQAVKERGQYGDIKAVVVPVTTGRTAALFSTGLKELSEVVAISEDDASSVAGQITNRMAGEGILDQLVEDRVLDQVRSVLFRSYEEKAPGASISRRDAFDITLLPLSGKNWHVVRDILYAFGHGMKVAIQVSIVAVELSRISPYTKIISVGGRHHGADTAIVMRASSQREAFGEDHEKRLSVDEILAMPVEKSFGESWKSPTDEMR